MKLWQAKRFCHDQTMNTNLTPHTPFKQLPPQAVALFFIQAMGARAQFIQRPPTLAELESTLAAVWDENQLTTSDLRDFRRMTNLIAEHFAAATTSAAAKAE